MGRERSGLRSVRSASPTCQSLPYSPRRPPEVAPNHERRGSTRVAMTAGRETPIVSSGAPASSGCRTVVASNSVDRSVDPGAVFLQELEVKASPGDTTFSDPVDYHAPHLHPGTVTARP